MRSRDIDQLIELLPKGRTLFYDFKDRYALYLLAHAARRFPTVRSLKSSCFAGLLAKDVVRRLLARTDGRVHPTLFESYWPSRPACYVLTLGRWGEDGDWRYSQMSRRGGNLVLQLNFSSEHDREFEELCAEDAEWFDAIGHPVHPRRKTLAWARLDIELDDGEALVEEIQSDWVLFARWAVELRGRGGDRGILYTRDQSLEAERSLCRYVERVLPRHTRRWEETMLAAVLWFLRDELGVRRIYYHTIRSGDRLKGFHGDEALPPRSLYSRLPRRFCFRETSIPPRFLARARENYVRCQLRRPDLRWFFLEL